MEKTRAQFHAFVCRHRLQSRSFGLTAGHSWFTVTMGTGIVSVLFNIFPYGARWLYWLSVVVFALNVVLFLLACLVSLLRYTLWPEIWGVMINHPNQALFVGALPMVGFGEAIPEPFLTSATESLHHRQHDRLRVCAGVGRMGHLSRLGVRTVIISRTSRHTHTDRLWMADAVLSLLSAVYMPFLLIKRDEETHLSAITALQLLPVVATVVAAASSGVVADVIPRPQQALATVIIGYVLWGVGVPTALVILVVYFHRLAIHKLPPREIIVSCFLPLGPLNMGAFGVMQLGSVAMKVFPKTKTIHPLAGDVAYNLGVFVALVMWGFTLVWLFFAVATIYHCKRFPFNMGWWG